MSATRKWTWTILRLVILVFLITGVVDVLIIGGKSLIRTWKIYSAQGLLDPISRYAETPSKGSFSAYEFLGEAQNLSSKTIKYKRLHIDLDPNGVSASYDIYLPKSHELFAMADRNAGSAEELAHRVLGAVGVDGSNQLLKFERVETEISTTDDNAHIYVSSNSIQPRNSTYSVAVYAKQLSLPLNIASKEVIVHTHDSIVHSGYLLPISKTAEETIYIFPPEQDELYFTVDSLRQPATPVADPASTLADLMKRRLAIPGDVMWFGILASLPFLLFLYWNRRCDFAATDEKALRQVKAIEIYLVFHFSYFFFYALEDLIADWRSPFTWALNAVQSRTLYILPTYPHYSSVIVPLVVMFLFVWPAVVRSSEPAPVRKPRLFNRILQVLALLVLGAMIWFVGWIAATQWSTLRFNAGALPTINFYLLFFGVTVLVLYVLCLLLARAQKLTTSRLRFALCLFLLLLIASSAEILYDFARDVPSPEYVQYKKYYSPFILLIFILAAYLVVRVFASIFYQAITGRVLSVDEKAWSTRKRMLIALLFLVIALSTASWSWPVTWWELWSLVWELKDFFLIALVWILADYLRRTSVEYDWLSLPEAAREAGILLALSTFYSPTTRWHYIPVAFIAGYCVLRFWLLPEKKFDRSVFSQVKAGMVTMIDRVIAFNDAERALKTLKKELLAKLGKGEIEPWLYTNKLQQQTNTVNALKQELTLHKRFAKDLVLAFGPGDSAWDNGRKAALYSLLFSIPWSLFYLRDLVKAPATFEGYLILDLLTRVILFVMTWVSYGFIFGYFYPHIRGHNGIQKGLALFLTIVIPDLVWTALALPLDGDNWLSFGFRVLQIFVHTMLLGMIAGDFAIMRAHGFRWNQLLEFYRLSSLSAWASSVILAIAAGVGTLIASGATQILTAAFKYIGAIQNDIPLPPK